VTPYYEDDFVTLYHGDMVDFFGGNYMTADAIITDPPYGETTLAWDSWPYKWPSIVSMHSASMWCFGSMRMFTERWADFKEAEWKLSQDIVWEKHNGTGFATDRFKRVHELAVHFYQGSWAGTAHEAVREEYHGPHVHARARHSRTPHTGEIGGHKYEDDGTRLVRSVIKAPSVRGGFHPTEKPQAVLDPLIRYSTPKGGTVLDPFAGSGSTLLAARTLGRHSVGIEANEEYCEKAAERLAVPELPFQESA